MKLESMTEQKMPKQDIYQNVVDALQKNDIDYSVISHTPVYTMEQASTVCGHPPEQGVKVLFLRVYTTKKIYGFALAVWTGNSPVDFGSISSSLSAKKIKMATPEEVVEKLGIEIGSLSPFGYENNFPLILDTRLYKQENIYINAGRHDRTIKLNPEGLKQLLINNGGRILEV